MAGRGPAPPLQRQQSAYSRLKSKGTIVRPSVDENIIGVARVIHRRIWAKKRRPFPRHRQHQGDGADGAGPEGAGERETEPRTRGPADEEKEEKEEEEEEEEERIWDFFDIDQFVLPEFKVRAPVGARPHAFGLYRQQVKRAKLPKPTVNVVFRFIKRIFDKAHLNAECAIIALIYCERLLEMKRFRLTQKNWIPIVLVALLTASKVWDDLSTWNIEFSDIFPVLSLRQVNRLEREFLNALGYNLYISGSVYAQYYFGLRTIRQEAMRGPANPRNIPKYYLQLHVGGGVGGPPRHVREQVVTTNGDQMSI